uniref:Uncharacterized protein n=1 Tax=Pipistrellus kuhlii TaxID=59472 RepID=A0A7J8B0R6_PIPKU|nr:hypothetical protein mPipKuh1_004810 [Pipistrellus kuhlii]
MRFEPMEQDGHRVGGPCGSSRSSTYSGVASDAFGREKHRCNEEIRIIRERQQRIDKELKRLQAKATKKPLEIEKDYKKFLRKLRNEAKFGRELLTSVSSSSSTEDNTGDEEEH